MAKRRIQKPKSRNPSVSGVLKNGIKKTHGWMDKAILKRSRLDIVGADVNDIFRGSEFVCEAYFITN